MGAVRDYFDVVGGVRSGLHDEPPWWASGGIALFGALVVAVVAFSLALGVDGGGSSESTRVRTLVPESPAVGDPPTSSADGAAAVPADEAADETIALADRSGTFQQVPRAAVDAARAQGATALGVGVGEVRHQLVSAAPGRVELSVSTLDGRRQVAVIAVDSGGSWQVT
jgi:hypothetical protein